MNTRMRVPLAACLVAGLAALAWSTTDSPSAGMPERKQGYRAMSIGLPGTQLAFVKKGDRVDVVATFEAKMKDGKEKMSATMLQNVIVTNILRPAKLDEIGVLELLVNPNEAQYLALSRVQGEIQVLVRAPDDTEMKPMEMAALRKLFR